jgi:formiminotetrahydrofolate cyclodeaminase
MLKELKLDELLNQIAADSPLPGGGTVACLAGAISSALVAMICNLTIGKKKYSEHEDELCKILENVKKLREDFYLLAEKDGEIFNEVLEAYGLPQESDVEKNNRNNAIQAASKKAAMVPMDVLRRCENLSGYCMQVAVHGNVNTISDAGVAASMANASAKSASLNILANLSTIDDDDFVSKLKTEQSRVLKNIRNITDETFNKVQSGL